MPHSKSTVNATVMIANKPITWPLKSLEIEQPSFEHHQAAVTVALDIEAVEESKRFLSIADFEDALGKSLTIKIEPADEYVAAAEKLEFVGIVSNVSFENDIEQINRVTFHAKSPTWLMDQAKINHFWEDQDLSSVLKGVLGKYTIETGEFKLPSETQPFLVQFKETDWGFFRRMCARESRWLYYDGTKLCIDQAKSKNTHDLDWIKHIGSFDLKMKVSNLECRADVYQEADKQQFFTDSTKGASSTDFSKLTRKAHAVSKSEFKDKSFEPFPEHAESEAKTVKFLANQKQARIGELVKSSVQSNVPSVKVGDTIRVGGMKDFSATYLVTEIKHVLEDGHTYYNEFEAVPLEIAHPSWKAPVTEIPQFQAGVVTDNRDPDGRYRVKVKLNYTDEKGDQLETPFLRVITHHAGGSHGTYFLPDVDDEVLVGFERDNPEKPVVIGNLWNGQVKPENALVNDDNNYKGIYTRGGNRIDIGDEGDKQYIKISNSGKNTIFLECDGPKIKVHTDGDLEIEAKENITMKSGKDFTIEAKGQFTAKADKQVAWSAGSNYTAEASGDVSIKGKNVNIDASVNVNSKAGAANNMKGSASAKVSAAMVDVEGSGPVTIKGLPINLN